MFAIINERFVAADSGWILGGYYWIYVSIESIESTEASMGETQLSGIIVYNLISNFLASRSHCQPTFLLSFVCLLLVEQRLISLLSAVVAKLD